MNLNRTILKSAKKHYALKRDPLSGARWDLVRDLRAVANELNNARMSDSGSSNYHTTQLGTAKKWNAARNSLMSLLRSANPYLTTDNLKTLASRIANKIGKLNLLIAKDVSVDEWNLAIIELLQIIRSLETALPYAEEIKRAVIKRIDPRQKLVASTTIKMIYAIVGLLNSSSSRLGGLEAFPPRAHVSGFGGRLNKAIALMPKLETQLNVLSALGLNLSEEKARLPKITAIMKTNDSGDAMYPLQMIAESIEKQSKNAFYDKL